MGKRSITKTHKERGATRQTLVFGGRERVALWGRGKICCALSLHVYIYQSSLLLPHFTLPPGLFVEWIGWAETPDQLVPPKRLPIIRLGHGLTVHVKVGLARMLLENVEMESMRNDDYTDCCLLD